MTGDRQFFLLVLQLFVCWVSVLLSALIEKLSVSYMRDLYKHGGETAPISLKFLPAQAFQFLVPIHIVLKPQRMSQIIILRKLTIEKIKV